MAHTTPKADTTLPESSPETSCQHTTPKADTTLPESSPETSCQHTTPKADEGNARNIIVEDVKFSS